MRHCWPEDTRFTKSAEKPRHSCRGGIGVGRAGLNAQEPNKTHAVPEPSMGEGTAEREAPAFMPGRTSPRWESNGLSHGAGASVQPDSVSAARPACGSLWGGSRGRTRTHIRLDAQPANPDLGRVSGRGGNSAPLNSGECEERGGVLLEAVSQEEWHTAGRQPLHDLVDHALRHGQRPVPDVGWCTRPLRIIPLSLKPAKMP